jgi:hypothetical protein
VLPLLRGEFGPRASTSVIHLRLILRHACILGIERAPLRMSRHENSKITLSAYRQPRWIEQQAFPLRLDIFDKTELAGTIKFVADAYEAH